MPDTSSPGPDPTLEAEILRAIAPLADLVSPEVAAECKELLTDALTTHPTGATLLARVRPAPEVAVSGEEGDGAEVPPAARQR